MKALVLAAGMGTRLKPWTDYHPKALAQVNGIPMLERVFCRIREADVDGITINVHHFADQIEDFISFKNWNVNISDERESLLETGGALLKAENYLCGDEDPILVHNADILSNLDIKGLEKFHKESGADVTLVVSDRNSSRKLIFDETGRLKGWHSLKADEVRPDDFIPEWGDRELAFAGIYIINPSVIRTMRNYGFDGRFSIIDYLMSTLSDFRYMGFEPDNLEILDIGKPESLVRAQHWDI